MYQKLNTPLNWLVLFLTPLFIFVWSQNGWGTPNKYWLTTYTHPDIMDKVSNGTVIGIYYTYQSPGSIQISPNGEWMWKKSNTPLFRNLSTGKELKLDLGIDYDRSLSTWLDNEKVLLKSKQGFHFLIPQSSNLSNPIPLYPGSNERGFYETDDISSIKNILESSQLTYSLANHNGLKPEDIFIIQNTSNEWQVLQLDIPTEHNELYEDLPSHIIFTGRIQHTNFKNNPNERPGSSQAVRYPSPDGRLYVKWDSEQYDAILGRRRNIFTLSVHRSDTDERIAYVSKEVFLLEPIGWAADNQTFYFQVRGEARFEASPIFSFTVDESLLEE